MSRTASEIRRDAEDVAAYETLVQTLERYATICGGYIHYNGHRALTLDDRLTSIVRTTAVQDTLDTLEIMKGRLKARSIDLHEFDERIDAARGAK